MPRSKNILGFAAAGILALVIYASAQNSNNPTINLPDGTQALVLQEYSKSYMVTKLGEHKPFFIEKEPPKITITNDTNGNDNKGVNELNDIVNNYVNHPPNKFYKAPTLQDSPQERQFKILNFPYRDEVPYVNKLIEVTENLKNSNYFGTNDITKYYISLRPNFEKYNIGVKDQGNNPNNTCAIFALASAIEYQLAKNGRQEKVSIPFLTWVHDQININLAAQGRLHMDGKAVTAEDVKEQYLRGRGRSIETCANGVNQYGIISAEDLPLSTINSVVKNGIPSNVATKASPLNITLTQCSVCLQLSYSSTYEATKNFNDFALKDELRKGNPVIAGIPIGKHPLTFIASTQDAFKGGRIQGHAILIVGFYSPTGRDEDTVYEFLNSWGSKWGNGGYGWVTSKVLSPAITALYGVTIN